jgi:hypothetical protein
MKHQAFGDDAMTDKTSKPEAPPAQPAELKDDKLNAVVGAGQTSSFSDGAQSYGLPLTDRVSAQTALSAASTPRPAPIDVAIDGITKK